jgi:hypothetical protein
MGWNALYSNTTASNNTAVGYQAAYSNITGTGVTAVGKDALLVSTGSFNTAIGRSAGSATTSGVNNFFGGVNAGGTNSTGNYNTAVGGLDSGNSAVLGLNTTGSNNTAFGSAALYSNTTASNSTAIGYTAGYTATGAGNTFVGYGAGYGVTTGAGNTFVGPATATGQAGFLVTTGSKNTILGGYTGNQGSLDIRTASNYIVLSDGDGNPLISTADNQTVALEGAVPNSGTGITFPATQSASSNANTLDDYEEGTWTPTLNFAGGTTGITYAAVRSGRYTKVGRIVTVSFAIILTSKGSSTGNANISGLPFASFNNGGACPAYAGTLAIEDGMSSMPTGTYCMPWSDSSLYLRVNGGTTYTAITDTTFTNTSAIYGSLTYEVT